ncbi:MAG: acetyl-CoA C-acetyltransferase [Deltaproteobacteria bacterium]|nr:acetyl-CoA C-acetyltransferase [Deltaproteobacteria bacterium]
MRSVVIASAVRTPIGNFNGALKNVPADVLGALVISEALKRAGLAPAQVDEVIMGNVLPHGLGQNPARQAMLKAGLAVMTGAVTINKVCGSSLKAVMMGAQAVACNDADVIIAGGMENMDLCPYLVPKARTGYRMGTAKIIDGMVHDGLWDVVNNYHMGYTAELVSDKFDVSKQDMDAFASNSFAKAVEARDQGRFREEIVPVPVKGPKGKTSLFEDDEAPKLTPMEVLAKLRPAFKKDGRITAGNSSKISDGASAVVLAAEDKVEELGLKPLARIGAQGSAGVPLEDVLVAPMLSIPKVLKKAGMTLDDIELHEINEAFAASTVAIIRELGIPEEKVNVNGGAVALGHPIGASGARILVTLLHALKQKNMTTGMASLCLGGGEAVSLIVERI